MSAVITHLWTSTIFLIVILIAARWLPLTARTRYALLFFGLLKFAIPAEAIVVPLRAAGIDLANLGRRSAGVIVIDWIGGPANISALQPQAASIWPNALLAAWIVTATALALAWAIARQRLVASALKAASGASSREHEALAAARRRLGLRASIEVTRSTICEAPALVRIIRPVIVLPDGGCDALDDTELESLLRHECAHVARRDNLLGLIESAIVAAFWFNPVLWIAQRAIATAREEACDETAAATADSIETYVSALSKICHAVLAPRLAGVSCMASAHLKERLNHLMRYERLRTRALSHPIIVALSAVAILAVAAASGMNAAPSSDATDTPFQFQYSVRPGDPANMLEISGRIVEAKNGLMLAKPHVMFPRKTSASIRLDRTDRTIDIEFRDLGTAVTAQMRITQNGVTLQDSTHTVDIQPDGPRNTSGRRYTGAPISLNLKDAEIKNVLQTFSQIVGVRIAYPPDLEGRVNLDARDMPWDEAFDVVLRQNGLTFELEDNAIVVKR